MEFYYTYVCPLCCENRDNSGLKSIKPVKSVAKIIEGALMDGGWIRYTILANKSMGEIGEEFPID